MVSTRVSASQLIRGLRLHLFGNRDNSILYVPPVTHASISLYHDDKLYFSFVLH